MNFSQDSFATAAALIENGYMPVQIPLGQKGPRIKGWQNRTFTAADFVEPCNIGIRCGDADVALLDIDIYDTETVSVIVSEWINRFGGRGSQMRRTGAAPKTAIPFRIDAGAKTTSQVIRPTGKAPLTAKGNPKIEQVEVHAEGRQFVAYGIHPDTQQPYHWHGLHPAEAVNGHVEALPYVTSEEIASFLKWVGERFGPTEPAQVLPVRPAPHVYVNSGSNTSGNSVIAAFNAMHSLDELLLRHGYTHRHGDQWTSPNSTTGSPNVQVIGERWRSLSGSDAALGLGAETKGGIRGGDAFDLFVHYQHGGNFAAAVKAYAKAAGLDNNDTASDANSSDMIPSEKRTFEELLTAARELEEEQLEEREAIISEIAHFSPSRRDVIFRAIKDATGVTLGTLRSQLAYELDAEPTPDHLDLARLVLDQVGHHNVLCTNNVIWRWQTGGVWAQLDDRAIKQTVQSCIEKKTKSDVTANLVASVYDLLKSEIYRAYHEFNLGNPETVNCLNGELELDDQGKWCLMPHRREMYRTTQIPVAYDPNAAATRFQTFLEQVFRDDTDKHQKIQSILEMMGYSLMSHARHERFVLLIGPGSNGKSVLLAVLQGLLGPSNIAGVQPSNFDNRFQRAHLHQKLANIVTELTQGEVIADAALKAITSGEPATVEHKHRDPFVMQPFATCWFGTNHMPRTRDFSDALFRRAIILQFNRVFTVDEQDPLLKKKLLSELPGILRMALQAYATALVNGFTMPQSSQIAKTEWKLEADPVAQFIDDMCDVNADHRISNTDIYNAFKAWARENGISQALSQKALKQRLKLLGYGDKKINSKRYVTGLDIRLDC